MKPVASMRKSPQTARSISATWLRAALVTGAVAAAALAHTERANAEAALCAAGARCAKDSSQIDSDDHYFRYSVALGRITREETAHHRIELSDQDYSSFSGVGVIVCPVNGENRSSTAFLVGSFDIAVTVAHTFEKDAGGELPADCVYNSMDSLGQVRERIPVSYIRSEWETEAGSFGHPGKDLAVVRLAHPSRYAQRTMPLGRFSGTAAPVVMVGFKADIDSDTVKRKVSGNVYERRGNGVAAANLAGFPHDMDSRGLSAGAPVIDERSGVIIGIHTRVATQRGTRNTMITMNDWLEATLRTEMQSTMQSASEAPASDSRPN
jgi:hypothetical protein